MAQLRVSFRSVTALLALIGVAHAVEWVTGAQRELVVAHETLAEHVVGCEVVADGQSCWPLVVGQRIKIRI